jgi:hypothetical protein
MGGVLPIFLKEHFKLKQIITTNTYTYSPKGNDFKNTI